nr:MAG TPA: Spermatid-specific manchette-related protein 1 [Caudoviricetes sp.]
MSWRVLQPVSGFCGRLPFEGVRQRLSGRGFTLRGEDCGRSQSPEGRASVS